MLGIKLIDKVPNLEIRQRTKINDILEEITKFKWKWAGHVEWQVRDGKRSKGRPKRTYRDDIQLWLGATWSRKANNRLNRTDLAEGYFQGYLF